MARGEVISLALDADGAGTMVITRTVMRVTAEAFTSDLGNGTPTAEKFTRMLVGHTFACCCAWRKNGGVRQKVADQVGPHPVPSSRGGLCAANPKVA